MVSHGMRHEDLSDTRRGGTVSPQESNQRPDRGLGISPLKLNQLNSVKIRDYLHAYSGFPQFERSHRPDIGQESGKAMLIILRDCRRLLRFSGFAEVVLFELRVRVPHP